MKIIIESKNSHIAVGVADNTFDVQMEFNDRILDPEVYKKLIEKLTEIKEILNESQRLIL